MIAVRWMMVLLAVSVLGGCAWRAPAPVAAPAEAEAEVGPSVAERVARVRALGGEEDGVEVTPVRDPELEHLLEQAAQAESGGDLDGASAQLEQALALRPGHPELLQQRAELTLLAGDVHAAIEQASEAWRQGPQVGSLCRRSWALMREAYEMVDYAEGVDISAMKFDECTVRGPVRM